ncbi:ATP-dependent dna helicase [Fusarium sporotrichioides]|uniref:ATP-dependent dna helicase n=1 Tax=Fusarium sporotrichioides TaxID=5514 RepID=A0A395SQ09_FUSSP|nr:ATP-dependent dna helicase [Fusarium sporotrichioides]
MDTLPPEIIRNIVSNLIIAARWVPHINERCPITSLAPYASISRQWRDIVESITFRHLILNSRRLNVAELENYLTPLRLSYIRYIWYDFEFPAHNLAASTNPEEDYDDQLVFNRSVRQLLEVLSRIPPREAPVVGLEIFITPPKKFALRLLRNETKRSRERTEVLFGNVIPAYVELFKDWDVGIAEIPAVTYFRVEPGSQSILFSPSSINRIASKMPRLSKVEWWLTDEENIDSTAETSQRTMFSRTLEIVPTSIRSFVLSYLRQPPRSAVDRPNSTVTPSTHEDILSRSFYSFTQRIGLDDFYLLARVDSTILLPQKPEHDAIWPSIRLYHLELKEHLPSGECIAQWQPGKGGYAYDQKIMDRFAIAAATCAPRMPRIEELNIIHHGRTQMGICFNTRSKGEPCLEFVGQPDVPEASEETLASWKNAVKTHGLKWDVNVTNEMGKVYHFY